MKQKRYSYKCLKTGEDIGAGWCCFVCRQFKRATTIGKKCEYEEVSHEYYIEV